ncbi:MAG: glmS [Chlamydiales bacterium]|jgi:glucosamine--fructose-6-phosphate aminotransferase (isomerizing)|nr:glmS [Chlamydiales bacterium]
MCGIFGYIGVQNAVKIAIGGLHKLAYRGYDSAGIGGLRNGRLVVSKAVGKINALEHRIEQDQIELDYAIAQTRWATHGQPTEVNAHPHCDMHKKIALVHNGIIENHDALREQLKAQGSVFASQTDSEVVVQLVASLYQGNFLESVIEAVKYLKGAWSLVLVHEDHPDEIIATASDMPLVVGLGLGETFISSDSYPVLEYTRQFVFVEKGEIARATRTGAEFFDPSGCLITKEVKTLKHEIQATSKGSFEHYTLKEIYEQPQAIKNALSSRFFKEFGTASLEGLRMEMGELLDVERILIIACGTSWHAGYAASYMFENIARIPTQVEISSEFRYKNPIILENTLVLAISQSGETADTLAAVREVKAKGASVIGLCNVPGSALAREADSCLLLRAGTEVGVCSTKAFTNQVVVLSLLTLLLARMRHMSKVEGQQFLNELLALPEQVQAVLNQADHIQEIAKKYSRYDHFFFLGRQYMYPASLEGSLKLKEIAYINANGYPAGEMKHGHIALSNPDCPTVALCANQLTYDKMLSNLMEVKARSGLIIAVAQQGSPGIEKIADDIIWIPQTSDELAVIPTTIATQLLAYYVAKERGAEIDQPRNLAKSVTVE